MVTAFLRKALIFSATFFVRTLPAIALSRRRSRRAARASRRASYRHCDRTAHRWHLPFAERWVVQDNFYINDAHWGRMFVRMCHYLPFWARVSATLDKLGERLLDANRTIGQPNEITTIFGRTVGKLCRGKLQTEIENLHLPNPVG
jgi:hypothetical protein